MQSTILANAAWNKHGSLDWFVDNDQIGFFFYSFILPGHLFTTQTQTQTRTVPFVITNLVNKQISPIQLFHKRLLDQRYTHFITGKKYSTAYSSSTQCTFFIPNIIRLLMTNVEKKEFLTADLAKLRTRARAKSVQR